MSSVVFFTCGYCKATFTTPEALRNHKVSKRNDEAEKNFEEGKKRRERHQEKRWDLGFPKKDPPLLLTHVYCDICDRDFATHAAGSEHWSQVSAQ